MPEDPVKSVDVRAWLRKAANDLRAAEVDLAAIPPLAEDAAFHCQQAAEKTLKALLAFHDLPFRKTHSLEELGQACLGLDPTLAPLVDRAAPLTEYAWAYRYPGCPEPPSLEEVRTALDTARTLCLAVIERLPAACRP